MTEIIDVSHEGRNYFGLSEFIVSGKFCGGSGGEESGVYIWYIKAPQCFRMRRDDNQSRHAPTVDLYKVENQLIHYLHEADHNQNFRERFGVGATGAVRAEGIMIGTNARVLADTKPQNLRAERRSLLIREQRLYEHRKIKVVTWDRILE